MAAFAAVAPVYSPHWSPFSTRKPGVKQHRHDLLAPKVQQHLTRPTFSQRSTQFRIKPAIVMAKLDAGDTLPTIPSLQTDKSVPGAPQSISLSEVVKETSAVIFVYPKADTSGCTKQACGFNDNLEKFSAAGYEIFGLSADEPPAQAAWKKKEGYRYTLLSDPSHEVLKALGVSDGARITRSHFIVEKGGKLKDIRYGISSGDSVPEALKAVGAGGEQGSKPTFSSL
eukprot:jgi/Botrbrau1/18339/Bobra.0179s0066.1